MQSSTDRPLPLGRQDALRLALELSRKEPALFLDFDGTLSEIVADPGEAILSDALRARLGRLAKRIPVAVISGRDLADVRARVGLEGVAYAGSHGLDIEAASGAFSIGQEFQPALARAGEALEKALVSVPGVLIERKRFGTTIHVRRLDPDQKEGVSRVVGAVASGEPTLRLVEGKEVLELRPGIPWDKGQAVLHLIRSEGWERRTPIYIGDDATDEDAFEVLLDRGVTIQVGDRGSPTLAARRLPDVDAVAHFVEGLLLALEGDAPVRGA